MSVSAPIFTTMTMAKNPHQEHIVRQNIHYHYTNIRPRHCLPYKNCFDRCNGWRRSWKRCFIFGAKIVVILSSEEDHDENWEAYLTLRFLLLKLRVEKMVRTSLLTFKDELTKGLRTIAKESFMFLFPSTARDRPQSLAHSLGPQTQVQRRPLMQTYSLWAIWLSMVWL